MTMAWAVLVVSNPIFGLLAFLATYLSVSLILMFLGAEYIAIWIILVYVGAVVILLLFCIMMLNIRIVETHEMLDKWFQGAFFIIIIFFLAVTYMNFKTFSLEFCFD